MRYEMGPIELVGWMILGGWLGFVICSLALNAIPPPPWSLGVGAGMVIVALFIMTGAAVPIVIYCRGKKKK
jgi:hypothetical protein